LPFRLTQKEFGGSAVGGEASKTVAADGKPEAFRKESGKAAVLFNPKIVRKENKKLIACCPEKINCGTENRSRRNINLVACGISWPRRQSVLEQATRVIPLPRRREIPKSPIVLSS
jgi:hypothetical protein